MNSNRNKFIVIFVFMIIVFSLLVKYNKPHNGKNKTYSGTVVKKYFYNNKGNGIEPRMIFYSDSLQMEIDVQMDYKMFDNLSSGDTISVDLNIKNINVEK